MSVGLLVVPTAKEQSQQFYDNLLNALRPPTKKKEPTQRTFAACEAVKGFILKSLHVEGAGELQLPLSAGDTVKLRRVCGQAPFGKGLATVVNTEIRRCWQVDGSKVTFPGTETFLQNTVQPLALKAVRELGLDGDGVQLEVHLDKLLLYEAGGHFTFHRDTEKEKGMFATFIMQLPTEEGYKGGELVVKHYNEKKKFDCQLISAIGFCYTVFFADCLHELQKIESGTRLCLAFNLVKGDSPLSSVCREFISSTVQKAEAALEPWLEETTERNRNIFGGKLAIPLQHKYTKENLSFTGLKGNDNLMAEVFKGCRDKNNDKWLDLHLCLVTKHQCGNASPRGFSDDICDDADQHSLCEVSEEDIEFEKRIGLTCQCF